MTDRSRALFGYFERSRTDATILAPHEKVSSDPDLYPLRTQDDVHSARAIAAVGFPVRIITLGFAQVDLAT